VGVGAGGATFAATAGLLDMIAGDTNEVDDENDEDEEEEDVFADVFARLELSLSAASDGSFLFSGKETATTGGAAGGAPGLPASISSPSSPRKSANSDSNAASWLCRSLAIPTFVKNQN
jgi:hypothetical protein